MKTLYKVIFCCAALFLIAKAQAGNNRKCKDFEAEVKMLEVSGILTIDGVRADDYWVYIFEDGVLNDSFFVANRFEQYFGLEFGHDYALKFKKTGYKDRVMLVDTRLPDGAKADYYTFRYDIQFISKKESNTFDDFPVCYVTYDSKTKDFDYNRTYHYNVRYNAGAATGQTAAQESENTQAVE